jgi:hypothetical protein
MHGVIEAWIRANATLEAASTAIDLAQQLNLEPSLVTLNRLCGCDRASKFSNAHKTNGGNKVNKALRDPDE